jgi:hypothetical protein
VTERVVDRLEVVEVQEEQRQARLVPLCRRDRLAEPMKQQHAVGQFGQRVELGRPRHHFQRSRPGLGVGLRLHHRQHQLLVGLDQPRHLAVAQTIFCLDHVLPQSSQRRAGVERLPL